ncbi:pseudouridine synthase [Ascodesmis nigricans]|uniref:tRNA pseudouridine(55) synthase n=1 Tax=Ascodesmis nigricans TaxID=341454 RepID=A0A4S2N759_9PEZI|nr:pseudouridine synthase [Ascodesmis nigricans]
MATSQPPSPKPNSPREMDSGAPPEPSSPKPARSPSPQRPQKEEPFQPLSGLIAINKPRGISSSQAMREVMNHFNTSTIFAPTLAHESSKRAEHNKFNRRRKNKRIEVKMGHGGTLDPMASGVLVLGIMNGTKQLQDYLTGTKTYEAVALFGCATDTYDALGKIIKTAPWEHVTKERVEKELGQFKGDIMQKPPLYSALHHEGKRYYEYAREGKPLPVEIQARPVTTVEMDLVGYTDTHEYKFPSEEVSEEVKMEAEVLEKEMKETEKQPAKMEESDETAQPGEKRTRCSSSPTLGPDIKKPKVDASSESGPAAPPKNPPTAALRMSVSKGFYVRSLVYDLGNAVDSAAHMVKLVRTQQGQWVLGKNVFEWEDIVGQPEEKWGKRVEQALKTWEKEKKATTGEE